MTHSSFPDTVGNLKVVVDLPSPCSFGDVEDASEVLQLDVAIEDGNLRIINASETCKTIFYPVDEGSDFLHRLSHAGPLTKFLKAMQEAAIRNPKQGPICTRFGKVQVGGCMSSLRYNAILDVFFPEGWNSGPNAVSFRFWPSCSSQRSKAGRKRSCSRRQQANKPAPRTRLLGEMPAPTMASMPNLTEVNLSSSKATAN